MGSSRQSMLTSWLASNSFDKDSISVLSADASFRQYYRATKSHTSYAVMDCPPEKENLESFLLITGKA
jgi:aminoglycoside/choline kinase family phosphotransferase